MQTAIHLLQELIRIPSVSSLSNRGVVDYASCVLQRVGWQTLRQPYRDAHGIEKCNLLAFPPGQNCTDRVVDLLFVCHTDTVPYSDSWEHAVKPHVANGFVYGCGACDVKGFLACLLTTISDINPSELNRSVGIVLTADEEIGCIGASKLFESQAILPKQVLIGEPTSLHPGRAGKGYCLAEITIVGREAHSAHPSRGASAIFRAARLIAKIEEIETTLRQRPYDFFDPPFTTLNVGVIEGGTAKNVVPGRCRFLLEWRPIPGENTSYVPAMVRQAAELLRRDDEDLEFEIQILREQPGFEGITNSDLVRRIESSSGKKPVALSFGSEAGVFSRITDDIVVFGPGDMRTAHSNLECVPIAELGKCVTCLKELITAPQPLSSS
jgi:acetylornithine deacetylase